MKKVFFPYALGVFCILGISAVLLSFTARDTNPLNKASQEYVDRVVPEVIAIWSAQELFNQASPEFLKGASLEETDSRFKMFAEQVGRYKKYNGSRGTSLVKVTPQGKIITAAYHAEVVFEKAVVLVKLEAIKHRDAWQILEFKVFSSVLPPN